MGLRLRCIRGRLFVRRHLHGRQGRREAPHLKKLDRDVVDAARRVRGGDQRVHRLVQRGMLPYHRQDLLVRHHPAEAVATDEDAVTLLQRQRRRLHVHGRLDAHGAQDHAPEHRVDFAFVLGADQLRRRVVLGNLPDRASTDAVEPAVARVERHRLGRIRRIEADAHKRRPASLEMLAGGAVGNPGGRRVDRPANARDKRPNRERGLHGKRMGRDERLNGPYRFRRGDFAIVPAPHAIRHAEDPQRREDAERVLVVLAFPANVAFRGIADVGEGVHRHVRPTSRTRRPAPSWDAVRTNRTSSG